MRVRIDRAQSVLIACVLAISAVVLVVYYPATKIGFVNNDWIQLDWAARWSPAQYFHYYLIPGPGSGSYRPVYGTYFWVMYVIFGPNPNAFHLAYVILHLLNGLLVFALVKRVTPHLSLAALAALLWVGFPAYSKAVYWPAVLDPLLAIFYLSTIGFWLDFLLKGERRYLLLTFLAFLLTLMTKEAGVTLPIVLFLVDRMFVRGPVSWSALIRRYAPFLLVWIPYLLMEYVIQKTGSYVNFAGYSPGIHMFWNLLNSLAALIYPWQFNPPLNYGLVAVSVVLFVWAALVRRSTVLALLGILIVLHLLPEIGFPIEWFEMRYLYLAAIPTAIIFALVLDGRWTQWRNQRAYMLLASGIVALALIVNGADVAQAVGDWGEVARVRAVPFRDIQRSHLTFPGPTKLYFVDSPTTPVYDFSVMFLLRYGTQVTVDGTDDNWPNRVANLRESPTSYVYYFDNTGKPIEVPVAQDAETAAAPKLPVTFSVPIRLEGYEVTANSLKRGGTVVLFLYWRAEREIKEDYNEFVHLVDSTGMTIAAYEAPPHRGKSPTSTWKPGELIVDSIVLPIPPDAPLGSSDRVEVGLSSAADNSKLIGLSTDSQTGKDRIVIAPFQIVE